LQVIGGPKGKEEGRLITRLGNAHMDKCTFGNVHMDECTLGNGVYSSEHYLQENKSHQEFGNGLAISVELVE
jgi:hypothetical protein